MHTALLARGARQAQARICVRALSTSSVIRKDYVQDLYLRELKAFKPTPQAKDAHMGQVKEFHSPSAPQKPDVPSSADLAKELEAYERSSPSDATHDAAVATEVPEESSGESADEFLENLRKPPVVHAAHH